MYQNMNCIVWCFKAKINSTRFDIYNAANEKIENPVYITANGDDIGVVVPYGGYIDIALKDSAIMSVYDSVSKFNIVTTTKGTELKLKVVRDYYTISSIENSALSDNQVI